eukprot:766662-Hanusia_phi.AAC.1
MNSVAQPALQILCLLLLERRKLPPILTSDRWLFDITSLVSWSSGISIILEANGQTTRASLALLPRRTRDTYTSSPSVASPPLHGSSLHGVGFVLVKGSHEKVGLRVAESQVEALEPETPTVMSLSDMGLLFAHPSNISARESRPFLFVPHIWKKRLAPPRCTFSLCLVLRVSASQSKAGPGADSPFQSDQSGTGVAT